MAQHQSDNFKQVKPRNTDGTLHDVIFMKTVDATNGETIVFTRTGTPPLLTEEVNNEDALTINITNSPDYNVAGAFKANANGLAHKLHYRFYEVGDVAPSYSISTLKDLSEFVAINQTSLTFSTAYTVDAYAIPEKGTSIGNQSSTQSHTYTTSNATGDAPSITSVSYPYGNKVDFTLTNNETLWDAYLDYSVTIGEDLTPTTYRSSIIGEGLNTGSITINNLLFNTTYNINSTALPTVINNTGRITGIVGPATHSSFTTVYPTGNTTITTSPNYTTYTDNIIAYNIINNDDYYAQSTKVLNTISYESATLNDPSAETPFSIVPSGANASSIIGLKFGQYAHMGVHAQPINPDHADDLGQIETTYVHEQFVTPTGTNATFNGVVENDLSVSADIVNSNGKYENARLKWAYSNSASRPGSYTNMIKLAKNGEEPNIPLYTDGETGLLFNTPYYLHAELAPEDPNNLDSSNLYTDGFYGNDAWVVKTLTTQNPAGDISLSGAAEYGIYTDNLINFTITNNDGTYKNRTDYGMEIYNNNSGVPADSSLITIDASGTFPIQASLLFDQWAILSAKSRPVNPKHATNYGSYIEPADMKIQFAAPIGTTPTFIKSSTDTSISFDINNTDARYAASNAKYIITDTEIASPILGSLTSAMEINNAATGSPNDILNLDFNEPYHIYAALAPRDPVNWDINTIKSYGTYGTIATDTIRTNNPAGNVTLSHVDSYINGSDLATEDNKITVTISDAAAHTYPQHIDYIKSNSTAYDSILTVNNGSFDIIEYTGLKFGETIAVSLQAAPINPNTSAVSAFGPNYETLTNQTFIFETPTGETPTVSNTVSGSSITFKSTNPNSGYRVSNLKYATADTDTDPTINSSNGITYGEIARNTGVTNIVTLTNIPWRTTKYFWAALAPEDPNNRNAYGIYGTPSQTSATISPVTGAAPSITAVANDTSIDFSILNDFTSYDISKIAYALSSTSITPTTGTLEASNIQKVAKNIDIDITINNLDFNQPYYIYGALNPEDPNNTDTGVTYAAQYYGEYSPVASLMSTTNNPAGNITLSGEEVYVDGGAILANEDNVVRFTITDDATYSYNQEVNYVTAVNTASGTTYDTTVNVNNGGSITVDIPGLAFNQDAYISLRSAPINPHTSAISAFGANYETLTNQIFKYTTRSGEKPISTSSVTDNSITFKSEYTSGYMVSDTKYLTAASNTSPAIGDLISLGGEIDRDTETNIVTLNNLPFGTTRYFWAATRPEDPNNRNSYGNWSLISDVHSNITTIPFGPGADAIITLGTVNYTTIDSILIEHPDTVYDTSYLYYSPPYESTPGVNTPVGNISFGDAGHNVILGHLENLKFNTLYTVRAGLTPEDPNSLGTYGDREWTYVNFTTGTPTADLTYIFNGNNEGANITLKNNAPGGTDHDSLLTYTIGGTATFNLSGIDVPIVPQETFYNENLTLLPDRSVTINATLTPTDGQGGTGTSDTINVTEYTLPDPVSIVMSDSTQSSITFTMSNPVDNLTSTAVTYGAGTSATYGNSVAIPVNDSSSAITLSGLSNTNDNTIYARIESANVPGSYTTISKDLIPTPIYNSTTGITQTPSLGIISVPWTTTLPTNVVGAIHKGLTSSPSTYVSTTGVAGGLQNWNTSYASLLAGPYNIYTKIASAGSAHSLVSNSRSWTSTYVPNLVDVTFGPVMTDSSNDSSLKLYVDVGNWNSDGYTTATIYGRADVDPTSGINNGQVNAISDSLNNVLTLTGLDNNAYTTIHTKLFSNSYYSAGTDTSIELIPAPDLTLINTVINDPGSCTVSATNNTSSSNFNNVYLYRSVNDGTYSFVSTYSTDILRGDTANINNQSNLSQGTYKYRAYANDTFARKSLFSDSATLTVVEPKTDAPDITDLIWFGDTSVGNIRFKVLNNDDSTASIKYAFQTGSYNQFPIATYGTVLSGAKTNAISTGTYGYNTTVYISATAEATGEAVSNWAGVVASGIFLNI